MKIPALFTTKRLAIALLLIHAVPLVVTLYHQALLTQVLPFIGLLALPCVGYLAWKQRDHQWKIDNKQTSLLKIVGTTALVFSLLLGLSWFVAQMSMQIQPVMFSVQEQPILVTVAANEALAYVVRNCVQAWVVIIGIALAYNALPYVRHSGFLANRFDKFAATALLFDWIVLVGLMLAIFSLMTFFVVNASSTVLAFFNVHQPLMPMLTGMVFILTFYMMNVIYGFAKRLRDQAKTKYSFAGILFRQTAFATIAWLLSSFMLTLLPMNFLDEMHYPVYFPSLNPERYLRSWNFLVLSWPFFLAPVMGIYLAKIASGLSIKKGILVFILVPMIILSITLFNLPSVTTTLMQWAPVLQLQEISLNDESGVFHVTVATTAFIVLFSILLIAMKCSKRFSESIVAIMPDRHGRREYRGRQLIAHFFLFFFSFLMVYTVLGVYGLFFSAAVYFLTVLLSIGLFYYQGISSVQTQQRQLHMPTYRMVT